MSPRKGFLGGIILGLLAAAAVVVAMRVHVTWDGCARAAPPAPPTIQPSLPPPSPAQVADARAISRTFAQVAEQLKPSVVAIIVEKKGGGPVPRRFQGDRRRGAPNPFEGTPFAPFFGWGNGEEMQMPKQVGAGSGVVVDAKGFIITNNHVIEGADVIKVRFADRREVKATVAGTDPKTDVAVIKVEGPALVPARFGDSNKPQVGEWVLAIGNPYGFDHTVTVGVISAKGRHGIGEGPYEDFLQTDAAINPGNSGGPLVNLDGEVIGINTAIRGIGTMIGFAIPSNMVSMVAPQLIKEGRVRRPYLGIRMQDVTPELSTGLGQNAPKKGAVVAQVEPSSPAQKAGVQPGDVIERIDGQATDTSLDVQKAVLSKALGQRIKLDLWRAGKQVAVEATVAENPTEKRESAPGSKKGRRDHHELGMELQTFTPELARQIGMQFVPGVVVTDVRSGSSAEDAGVREGDVIVEVDRRGVNHEGEAAQLLSTNRPGGHLLLVRRGDGTLFLVIPQE